MKKFILTILLFCAVSCTPVPIVSPTSTTAVVETVTTAAIVPLANQTQSINGLVRRAYNPNEWKQLYDKDTVWTIVLDQKQQTWVVLDRGQVGFFDGNKWVLFSEKDYGFSDKVNDIAIGQDGAVWISGDKTISLYQNERWVAFPIPNMDSAYFTNLSIDPYGMVWVITPTCNCKFIRNFEGNVWSEFTITNQYLEASQVIFTPNGALWAAYYRGGIARYDGKIWKIYSGTDLWPKYSDSVIRIASDSEGNVYGIYEGQDWIIKINKDGSVSNIPFDYSDLDVASVLLRLFVDRQGTIWVNACLKNSYYSCLAYYKDGQWVSFTNLPFSTVTDINELPDGTVLVATSQGLYQFKSAK